MNCERFGRELPCCILIRASVCTQLRDDVLIAISWGAERERALIPANVGQMYLECLWNVLEDEIAFVKVDF